LEIHWRILLRASQRQPSAAAHAISIQAARQKNYLRSTLSRRQLQPVSCKALLCGGPRYGADEQLFESELLDVLNGDTHP
jgi:hypothetical protein